MDYLSSPEAAKNQGVSYKNPISRMWLIVREAEKPVDGTPTPRKIKDSENK